MTKRVLCLDVGEKRIGVAVSDALGLTAQGVETIFTKGEAKDQARVRELLKSYETDRLLVGLPKSLSGAEGPQAGRVRDFCKGLQGGIQIRFSDERLTTVSATRALLEGNVRRDKRKDVVDKLAAVMILQGFLDGGGWKDAEDEGMDEDLNMESGNPVVELVDEDGVTVRFEHVATVPFKGDEYVLLSPIDPVDDIEDDEVIIMRIEPGEAEDSYISVDDEAVLEEVFNLYLEMDEDEDEE